MASDERSDATDGPEDGVVIYINGFPVRVSSMHTTFHREGKPVGHREVGDFRQASDAVISPSGELQCDKGRDLSADLNQSSEGFGL